MGRISIQNLKSEGILILLASSSNSNMFNMYMFLRTIEASLNFVGTVF